MADGKTNIEYLKEALQPGNPLYNRISRYLDNLYPPLMEAVNPSFEPPNRMIKGRLRAFGSCLDRSNLETFFSEWYDKGYEWKTNAVADNVEELAKGYGEMGFEVQTVTPTIVPNTGEILGDDHLAILTRKKP